MPANTLKNTLIQAWVPHETAAVLRAVASDSDRSVAAEIRRALRVHLASSEISPLNDDAPAGSERDVTTSAVVGDGYDPR